MAMDFFLCECVYASHVTLYMYSLLILYLFLFYDHHRSRYTNFQWPVGVMVSTMQVCSKVKFCGGG